MSACPKIDWRALQRHAGPHPPNAFIFVQEGLGHTIETLARTDPSFPPEGRHVTGQELCMGLRDLALQRFGPLARTVLASWGIHSTEDFGRLVFALVDAGLLRKTDEDSLDDFRGVYDFDEAFGQGVTPQRNASSQASVLEN